MKGNATNITDQIMKYLRDSKAPFLAVFDWNTMGIFDFTGYRPESRAPGYPTFTSMRETKFGPHVHETHRLLLLGFLLRALEWQRHRQEQPKLDIAVPFLSFVFSFVPLSSLPA